jgi:mannitol/fructose-specific phosphotransferase system IIA component (Ntr-type)
MEIRMGFAFGAADRQAHTAVLQQLAGLVGNKAAVDHICAAGDDHGLLSVIQAWSG